MSASASVTLSTRIRRRVSGGNRIMLLLLHRWDARIALMILSLLTLSGVAPEILVGPLQTATTATAAALLPPSGTHLFGTDDFGRDLLNLTVHGARISLVVGALSAAITLVIGGGIGMIAGYRGGRTDALLMRVADTFLILPTFVLALILAPILRELIGDQTEIFGIRTTLLTIVAVIGFTSWSSTARIVRSQTLSLRERTFVERARLVGLSPMRIIARHIFPNIRTVLVANGIVVIAGSILTESTLSFIGLGDPFQPSWGTILGNAQSAAAPSLGAWWFITAPGCAILLTVAACTIVGNAIDELLDRDVRVQR